MLFNLCGRPGYKVRLAVSTHTHTHAHAHTHTHTHTHTVLPKSHVPDRVGVASVAHQRSPLAAVPQTDRTVFGGRQQVLSTVTETRAIDWAVVAQQYSMVICVAMVTTGSLRSDWLIRRCSQVISRCCRPWQLGPNVYGGVG